IRENIHHLAVAQVAPDMACDGAAVFSKIAPHQSIVKAFNGAVVKFFRELIEGELRLGDEQKAGSVFVNAMYKAGLSGKLTVRLLTLKMIYHGIQQRVLIVAESGMHNHSCGLVYDNQIVVFVKDVERNVLRDEFDLAHRLWKYDLDFI